MVGRPCYSHGCHDEEAVHRSSLETTPSTHRRPCYWVLTIPLPQLMHYGMEQARWSMVRMQGTCMAA